MSDGAVVKRPESLRVGLVGPLPPPAGGMATQCQQLKHHLEVEGIQVVLVQTNAPYRPEWMSPMRGIRALFRALPYLRRLWRTAGEVDVMHVLANSGWAWHLCAAPAVWIARLRSVPVIVNYRGGDAERFFTAAPAWVMRTLAAASVRITPSGFLQEVFSRFGLGAEVIPNGVDLAQFRPAQEQTTAVVPHIIVTRNLEAVYDVGTALEAVAMAAHRLGAFRMTIAGEGVERESLVLLAARLGLADRVEFCGRLDRAAVAKLYRSASLMVNPSTIDNMPNSVLEAFASAVPVVSTDVGGVRFIARHGVTALLVPPRDPRAMADAVCRVWEDARLRDQMRAAGLLEAQRYAWPTVRKLWVARYASLVASRDGTVVST